MNTSARITIRFLEDLPIVVHGGLTSWRIEMGFYGKNGSRAEIYAKRVGHPRTIKIANGRTADVQRQFVIGFTAVLGTEDGETLYRIFSKLVHEGRAARVV